MAWPMSQDYNEAIQDPAACFTDAELKQGEAVCNALGLPVPCSGNFADVYAVQNGTKKWAVKCFTRQIPGLQERYVQVSQYLQQVNLPFMVEFAFLEQGIKVRGQWYPILKMQWVEGFALNAFVRDNLDKPAILQTLCQIWVRLAQRLREANLAHCDLQHGNVLLVPGSKAGSVGVKLVDYDGMCVPALELLKSIELGQPNFQHPQRLRDGTYGLQIDRFPHLVIYTALRALSVGGKALWDRFDNGDNLLFTQKDFEAPAQAAIFQELQKSPDAEVRKLAKALAQAAQQSIEQVPLLEELVETKAAPRPQAAPTKSAAPTTKDVFAAVASGGPTAAGRRSKYQAPKKSSAALLLAAGGGAVVLLLGGILAFFAMRSTPTTKPEAVAQVETPKGRPSRADRPDTKPMVRPETKSEPKTDPEVTPEPKKDPKVEPPVVPEPKKVMVPGKEVKQEAVQVTPEAVAFTPDRRRALIAAEDHSLILWDLDNGKQVRRFPAHTKAILGLAVSPDGRRALSSSDDKTVRLWDLSTGKELLRCGGETSGFWHPTFSADGQRALSGGSPGEDRSVWLWDLATGKELLRFDAVTGKIRQGRGGRRTAEFVPDGRHAISSAADYSLRLWELTTGNEVRQFAGHSRSVIALCVSADGKLALSGSEDQTAKVWDVAAGRELKTLSGHSDKVTGVALSPDGQTALTASADRSIRVWDTSTGQELQSFDGHEDVVWNVGFTPDGRQAWSGSKDGTLRLWQLPGPESGRSEPKTDPKPEPEPKVGPDDAWVRSVAALPPQQQVEEVARKLKELNPGYDGTYKHVIMSGVVIGLDVNAEQIADISPLAALKGLKRLTLATVGNNPGKVADLSPLKGLLLTTLTFHRSQVKDLSPLKDMPLTDLGFYGSAGISDLSPLQGMPLQALNCYGTKVKDLSPLSGMPLRSLDCTSTGVADLSPLKGCPLTYLMFGTTRVKDLSVVKDLPMLQHLGFSGAPITDLSPLRGSKVTNITCPGVKITDFSPLKETPLKDILCDYDPARDAAVFRAIKTLEVLNRKPAKEVLK